MANAKRSAAEWAETVAAYRKSGKKAQDFADANAINVTSLRHWAWKLETKGKGETTTASPKAKIIRGVRKVKAAVRANDGQQRIAGTTIQLPSGVVIIVPVGVDGSNVVNAISRLAA